MNQVDLLITIFSNMIAQFTHNQLPDLKSDFLKLYFIFIFLFVVFQNKLQFQNICFQNSLFFIRHLILISVAVELKREEISHLGMATRRDEDKFRYPISISIEKIHHHPHIQTQRISTFVSFSSPLSNEYNLVPIPYPFSYYFNINFN